MSDSLVHNIITICRKQCQSIGTEVHIAEGALSPSVRITCYNQPYEKSCRGESDEFKEISSNQESINRLSDLFAGFPGPHLREEEREKLFKQISKSTVAVYATSSRVRECLHTVTVCLVAIAKWKPLGQTATRCMFRSKGSSMELIR